MRPTAAILLILLAICPPLSLHAESTSTFKSIPPFILDTPKPNVLIILDNSNSMDEDVNGNAVGSDHPTSRSEIARNAIEQIIEDYGSVLRIGLMTYRQSNIQKRHIHNSPYYVSHDPDTYDPDGPFTPQDATTNTLRAPNPSNPGSYVYYDQALPMYSGNDLGRAFCYATGFQIGREPIPPDGDINTHIHADGTYQCYRNKIGDLDVYANNNHDNDAAAINQYSSNFFNSGFDLTDSDVAAGFYQIGAQVMWYHVGLAWLSTTHTVGGQLHAAVNDVNVIHRSVLNAKLATSQFDDAVDTPIRNAGFTPIRTTLESAQAYFQGQEDTYSGVSYTSPVTKVCQEQFIVLVTDGLPTEDPPTGGDRIAYVADQATALRSTTVTVDGSDETFDVKTYVLGFALPRGMDGALDPVAVAAGTDVEGSAYYAGNETELGEALASIFRNISIASQSGTAASVISSTRTGEGAIFQAIFRTKSEDADEREVYWTGDLHGYFIDDHGYMRESEPETDGSQVLDVDPDQGDVDKYISMCYDSIYKTVRVKKSDTVADLPTQAQIDDCGEAVFNLTVGDIHYLWSAEQWLAELSDGEAASQRSYDNPAEGRHILTAFDSDGDGLITVSDDHMAFLEGSFTAGNAGLLQAADEVEAANIVNYIRGVDQAGFRSRQLDYDGDGTAETMRLGDIVYSTPISVSRPAEDLDLIYRDDSYREFARQYRNRRQVVYVGANDGMLHAFNAGFFDAASNAFRKQPLTAAGIPDTRYTAYDLGAELWAYVPYNLLPHLKYLTETEYGEAFGDHVCFVDLTPRVFDAKIFTPSDVHTNGWGTVMVAGMRLGGGALTVTVSDGVGGSVDRTLRSAYMIFDITDPESAPQLLCEFTHPNLGFTTSMPAPVKIDDDWYLMMGSGPYPLTATTLSSGASTQKGKLFLLDLKTMSLVSDFGTGGILESTDDNSFYSGLITADWDLYQTEDVSYSSDAVYFGTIAGTTAPYSGKLQRVRTLGGPAAWSVTTLYNANKPIAAAPTLGLDPLRNRWVFVGTGRLWAAVDREDQSQQRVVGIKEPLLSDDYPPTFAWDTQDAPLEDVSTVTVYEQSQASKAHLSALRSSILSFERGGWKMDLADTGERVLSQAALFGDILTFTSYIPAADGCAEGLSYLYALYYLTGTAYINPVIGLGSAYIQEGEQNKQEVLKRTQLGMGMASSPSIHTGRQDTSRLAIQQSTSNIVMLDENNPGPIKSARMVWGERPVRTDD